MRYLRFLLFLLFLLPLAVHAQDAGGDLLARVNNLRASQGLPAYAWNGALAAAAQSQAQWMAESGVISHNRPDGSGPRSRAIASGYATADVAENIYGGTNASIDAAWTFWVNSGIHYAGLVNTRYQEIGIGAAQGSDMRTFVLVFGNPGGVPFVPPSSGGGGSGSAAAPPSYVLGLDEHGNILHEVQPGDTLGDIALLYGYTWDDIPYMKQINGIEDNRLLEVGSVFLVPPQDGTYTPTPGSEVPTAATVPASQQATLTPEPSATATLLPSPTLPGIATAAAMPEAIVVAAAITPTESAAVVPATAAELTPVLVSGVSTITRGGPSNTWLVLALAVQAVLLTAAGFEFARRSRRRKRK